MLREIPAARQVPGESRRRWFNDEAMDLFVWLDEHDDLVGFQLTYDKPHAEKALTWKRGGSLTHAGVDEGARPGKHPGSPILVADGEFDAERVLREFRARCAQIDHGVGQFVAVRIEGGLPRAHAPAPGGPPRWRYAIAAALGLVAIGALVLLTAD